MAKKLIAIFLVAVITLSFASCSKSTTPSLYNEVVLSINGEDITYEYYRYYYLSAYQSYDESNRDQIFDDVLDKLLYDRAVDLILTENKIGLTEEEKAELSSMLAMYETTYGDTFHTQLEKQNMTVNVFNETMTNMVKYNKLYEYFSDEKNNALDFSNDAVQAVLDGYDAGLHFVINKGGSLSDGDAKQLAAKAFSMIAVSEVLKSTGSLILLKENIKYTQDAIEEINSQIESGSTDKTLVTTLSTLTKKLGEYNSQLATATYPDISNELVEYKEKVKVYLDSIYKEINGSVDSDDAALIGLLNDKDLEGIKKYLKDNSVKEIKEKLCTVLSSVTSNAANYGWLPNDYKDAVAGFTTDPSLENGQKLISLFNGNGEMDEDTLLANINKVVEAYCSVLSDTPCHLIKDNLENADGLLEIEIDFVLVAEFAACLEAIEKAEEITSSLKGGDLKANDIPYEDIAVLNGVVYGFEEVIALYSDGYNSEADTQMFYYSPSDLIPELSSAVSNLKPNEFTEIIETPTGFHVFKVLSEDLEHFKETYYVYASLENQINKKADSIEYTLTDLYNSLTHEKIQTLEKELEAQIVEIKESFSEENQDKENVMWTVIIIVGTVAVVVVLTVAIIYSSKAPSSQPSKKSEKYKVKSKSEKK